MTRKEQETRKNYWMDSGTLQVVMLVGVLAVVGISIASQRQIIRMDNRLDVRLDKIEARLESNPANETLAVFDRPAPEVPVTDQQVTSADADPTSSGLVGVKPVGSKMPDSNRVYEFDLLHSPSRGPTRAPITVVEFSDFECSFCRKVQPTLARIESVYGDQVRLVWKHLPLSIHKNAPRAHLASVAAANQGKFWEYRNVLFANPGKLGPDDLRRYAFELGLRMQQFEDDLQDPKTREVIESDMAEAVAIDLTASPGFFINGRYIRGAKPFEDFAEIINDELEKLGLPVPEAARFDTKSGSS